MLPPYLTKKETAERLRYSERTVERLLENGDLLRANRRGARVRIAREDLLAYEARVRASQ